MGWSSATLILVCECTLFVAIGTWATDHSIFLWRTVLMNGLVHQTATLALITTSRYQTSLSTTTLRCSAGNITHKHTARLKIYIQISFPMTQWNSLAVCSSGWVECLSPPPPALLPSLYQLCLCIPFSAHLFSPKQPYVYSGSLELAAGRVFRLAMGLISTAYLGPGQKHTHT